MVVGVGAAGVFDFGGVKSGVGFLFEFFCEVEVVGESRCHDGGEHEDAGFAEGGFVVGEGYGVDEGGGDVGEGGGGGGCGGVDGAPVDLVGGEGDVLDAEAVGWEVGGAVGEGKGGVYCGPGPAGVVEAEGDGVLGEGFAGVVFV